MGFYHQIDRAFRLKFSHHPILWEKHSQRRPHRAISIPGHATHPPSEWTCHPPAGKAAADDGAGEDADGADVCHVEKGGDQRNRNYDIINDIDSELSEPRNIKK